MQCEQSKTADKALLLELPGGRVLRTLEWSCKFLIILHLCLSSLTGNWMGCVQTKLALGVPLQQLPGFIHSPSALSFQCLPVLSSWSRVNMFMVSRENGWNQGSLTVPGNYEHFFAALWISHFLVLKAVVLFVGAKACNLNYILRTLKMLSCNSALLPDVHGLSWEALSSLLRMVWRFGSYFSLALFLGVMCDTTAFSSRA